MFRPHCTGDLQLMCVQPHLVQVGQKVLSMLDVGTLTGRGRWLGKGNGLKKGGNYLLSNGFGDEEKILSSSGHILCMG